MNVCLKKCMHFLLLSSHCDKLFTLLCPVLLYLMVLSHQTHFKFWHWEHSMLRCLDTRWLFILAINTSKQVECLIFSLKMQHRNSLWTCLRDTCLPSVSSKLNEPTSHRAKPWQTARKALLAEGKTVSVWRMRYWKMLLALRLVLHVVQKHLYNLISIHVTYHHDLHNGIKQQTVRQCDIIFKSYQLFLKNKTVRTLCSWLTLNPFQNFTSTRLQCWSLIITFCELLGRKKKWWKC